MLIQALTFLLVNAATSGNKIIITIIIIFQNCTCLRKQHSNSINSSLVMSPYFFTNFNYVKIKILSFMCPFLPAVALQCYSCDSTQHQDCASPFNSALFTPINCTAIYEQNTEYIIQNTCVVYTATCPYSPILYFTTSKR